MSTVKMCDKCGDTRQRNDLELGDWITVSIGVDREISKTSEFCTAVCAQLGLEQMQREHTLAMIDAVEQEDDE